MLVVTIFIVCIVAALYRAATRALAGRRQAPALPRAERTSFEDWIEIFREIAVAAEGELSPELTQLLASPSETLAARARLIEQAKTEAAGLVREAGAEAERLLGEARSERFALLRAGAAASAGPAASNWLAG